MSPAVTKSAVWAARLAVGAVFILSGWSKCVDPWGFVYKIEDYLAVWGILAAVPREFTLVGSVALSMLELCTGLSLALGCLRRTAAIAACAIMAAMLPLSVYIWVADPVADCGCFGDLLVISNAATMAKNIVITALAVFLAFTNTRVAPGIRPALQWIMLAATIIYGLALAVTGWHVQPVADFRPYPIGSEAVVADSAEDGDVTFIYEKDGERREFALDALPDSTWTWIGRAESDAAESSAALALFDEDGYDVTSDVLGSADGDVLLITVPEPGVDYLTRARFANELYRYATDHGIGMVAAVAATDDGLERWRALARPQYPVYTASDTALKQLVRGTQGFVWIHDGRIAIKRNLAGIGPDILSAGTMQDELWNVADGRLCIWLSAALAAVILLLWSLGRVCNNKKSK